MKKRKIVSILMLLILVFPTVLLGGCKSILQGIFGTNEPIVTERVDIRDANEHKRAFLNKTKKTATLYEYNYLDDSDELVVCEIPSQIEYEGEMYTVTEIDSEMDVKYISNTFSNKRIKELVIPSTVKMIRLVYFNNLLQSLEKITVHPDNAYYKSIDGVLYNKNQTALLYYPRNKTDIQLLINKDLKTISDELVCNRYLESIVVEQGNKVFSSVEGVLYSLDGSELLCYPPAKEGKHFIVPNCVKTICSGAFAYRNTYNNIVKNNELETVFVSNGVEYINPDSVFLLDLFCESEVMKETYRLSVSKLTLHLNTSLEQYQTIVSTWEETANDDKD